MSDDIIWHNVKQSVHYVTLCQIMSLLCHIIFPIILPIMSNLSYYFSYYVKLCHLFFLLFSIIPGCQHPVHRSWQTHKLVLCTEKGLTSDKEGQQCFRMNRAAGLVKISPCVQQSNHYYTHYSFYYTHYFTNLNRIKLQISWTYALQVNVQWTHVILSAIQSSRKLTQLIPWPHLCCLFPIILIMSLLFQLYLLLY